MTAIARLPFDSGPIDPGFWPRVAAAVDRWLASEHIPARDAIVLLPHAALLPLARTAFARQGGWQPRIETVHTLAAALGPPPAADAAGPTGDLTTDRMAMALLLRSQGGLGLARDAAAFDAAVDAAVETAQALHEAAAARPPDEREAWWAALRGDLPPVQGPGATERLLARVALEWAAAAEPPPTDRLWRLRPAAWIAFAGGRGPAFETQLLQRAERACWVQAAAPDERPFQASAVLDAPTLEAASGFEAEAQAATLAVLQSLDAGASPVALIAQDREVVRRIRALIERTGVAIADETGWTLSTTRAAASLMACLRAALPQVSRDALVEALKVEQPLLAGVLEAAWRSQHDPPPDALRALHSLQQRFDLWHGQGRRSLWAWLQGLAAAIPQVIEGLAADGAGRQVLAALRLDARPASAAWRAVAEVSLFDLPGFLSWVDQALEAAVYLPAAPADAPVVITPLQRALWRPFAAVVFPGCDERHLGARLASPGLLPAAVAARHGVDDAAARLQRETTAFAQLLRVPRVHLLRRSHDGDEPLAASTLCQRAWIERRRCGSAVPAERPFVPPRSPVPRRPLGRPAPSMAERMPKRLSASAIEALRDCPYRFFARTALGLAEVDELDAALDKSDHGRWLHHVLHRFHSGRRPGDDDLVRLLALADEATAQEGLDAAEHWPFRAAFDVFARQYLDWLQSHESAGWRYREGELARRCAPPELGGVALEGRLDRIDRGPGGAAMVIDYKTGQAQALRQRVRRPDEDTQLAVYAALLTDEPHDPPPRAIYLALDDREPPQAIEHDDVAHSAALLVDGLAADLDALRSGAGAPALGEGDACRHCAARGLCRRDHWSEPS